MEATKAAGIPIGAYYFIGRTALLPLQGKADAERFIKILKGKRLEYPVYMDNESATCFCQSRYYGKPPSLSVRQWNPLRMLCRYLRLCCLSGF